MRHKGDVDQKVLLGINGFSRVLNSGKWNSIELQNTTPYSTFIRYTQAASSSETLGAYAKKPKTSRIADQTYFLCMKHVEREL